MTGRDYLFTSEDLGEKQRNKPAKVVPVDHGTCLYYNQDTGKCKMKQRCARNFQFYELNYSGTISIWCTRKGQSGVGVG